MSKGKSDEKIRKYDYLIPLSVGILFLLLGYFEEFSLGSIATIVSGVACLFLSSGFFYYGNLRNAPLPGSVAITTISAFAVGSLISLISHWNAGSAMNIVLQVIILLFFLVLLFRAAKKIKKR